MFLKIQMNEFTKKIKFSEKYHSFTEFIKMIEEVLEKDFKNVRVYFFDQENDKVFVEDEFDLEYLIENSKNSKFLNLHAEEISTEKVKEVVLEEQKEKDKEPVEFIEISKIDENIYRPEIYSEVKPAEEFKIQDESEEEITKEMVVQENSKLIEEIPEALTLENDANEDTIDKQA